MSLYPLLDPTSAEEYVNRTPKVLRYHPNVVEWSSTIDVSNPAHVNYDVLPGGHRLYSQYDMVRGLVTRISYFMDEAGTDLAIIVDRSYNYVGMRLESRVTTRTYYGEDDQPIRIVEGARKLYTVEAPEVRRRENVINQLKQLVGPLLVLSGQYTPETADEAGTAFISTYSPWLQGYKEIGLRNFRLPDGTPARKAQAPAGVMDAIDMLEGSQESWLDLSAHLGFLSTKGVDLSALPANPTIRDVMVEELLEPWVQDRASLTMV